MCDSVRILNYTRMSFRTFQREIKMQHDELLDKDQARKVLGGIGNTKFYQLLASGEVAACKIGRRTFCRRSELERYLASLPAYKAENAEA